MIDDAFVGLITLGLILGAICAVIEFIEWRDQRRKASYRKELRCIRNNDQCPADPIPWDDPLDVSKLEVRHEPGSQD